LGEIRIIAGALRGRKIRVPAGVAVRPTSDRVRESLFDILAAAPEGARVLDLYAGSGALGFEALSRGAVSVTFVESGREAGKVLRANAASLGVETRCRIVQGDAIARLGSGLPGAPFDLAFADPPYALGQEALLLEALTRGALSPGARLVFERDRAGESPAGPSAGFRLDRTARYGRTCIDFYRWEPGPPG
jgi:16S rRNA (guanine966-N2)-methyltransferase